jgi:hypothetical protein
MCVLTLLDCGLSQLAFPLESEQTVIVLAIKYGRNDTGGLQAQFLKDWSCHFLSLGTLPLVVARHNMRYLTSLLKRDVQHYMQG